MWYFYILRCRDKTLYSGSTNNLKNREKLHNSGKGSVYVRARGGGKIVYWEKYSNRSEALKREARVKKLTRADKIGLIKKYVGRNNKN